MYSRGLGSRLWGALALGVGFRVLIEDFALACRAFWVEGLGSCNL